MGADIIPIRKEKIVFDTSIYISNFRSGIHQNQITETIRSTVIYLHSVVFEELLAGMPSKKEKKKLFQFKKIYSAANRLITPNDRDWEETGLLVNEIIRNKKMQSSIASRLTHDILIAISSRREGIRVITENKKDFLMIQHQRDFKLSVWPPN